MSVFWWSYHGFCAASDSAVVARSGTQSPPPQFQRSYGHGRGRDLSPPRRGGFPPAWPRSGSDPERAPASDSGSRAEGAPSMAMKGSMHLYSSPLRELILNEQLIGFASPGDSSSFARLPLRNCKSWGLILNEQLQLNKVCKSWGLIVIRAPVRRRQSELL